MNRREFIVATSVIGGGMALALVPCAEGAAATIAAAELTPWIVIGADNIVTVRVPGPESGTGNSTQAAMFVAEELECDWDKVRVEPISFNRNTREGNLYLGATGIWSTFAGAGASGDVMKALMQAGASARERLRAAAAAQWKVPVKEIEAKSGVLSHARTSRQATLRRTRGPGRDHQTTQGAGAQTARAVDAAHQANIADGARAIRREWQLGVRHRRSRAGDALCRVAAVPGARRQARRVTTSRRSKACRACAASRWSTRTSRGASSRSPRTGPTQRAKRHRGDCRALLAGAQGAGGAAGDLGLRPRRAVEDDPADLRRPVCAPEGTRGGPAERRRRCAAI